MALTKATLIDQMTDQLGFTRKQSTAVVESLLEIIKSALAAGDDDAMPPARSACTTISPALRRGNHTVRVRGVNDLGEGPWSVPFTFGVSLPGEVSGIGLSAE